MAESWALTAASWLRRGWASFSYVGLVAATLLMAASLTPSLLPRHYLTQGLLSGFALATGYGLGVFGTWLWGYLELPTPSARTSWTAKRLAELAVALAAAASLWWATVWQNSIRALMEMPPAETAYPWRVLLVALATALVLLLVARGLGLCWMYVHRRAARVIPRRVSYVLTTTTVAVLALLVVNKVFARLALSAADAIFLQIDEMVDEGLPQPVDSRASGSAESLVPWDSIGLQGKRFIVDGPTEAGISQFWGEPADQPLRVYVGVRTVEETAERARLALAELKRVGGFERSVLIVATPTGTGWLDPGAVDTVEYLHRGDTAIVSMQYSYLPSWITILVDPQRSRVAARALFDEVYAHWRTLPKDSRPRLYLHGLSLGSLGSESSADLFTLFEEPIQGGVWSGPPFPSTAWSRITRGRNADSPVWLPTYRDGSMVRFTGRENAIAAGGSRWSPMRFVYLQHASDPMTFFSPEILYRRPEWLVGPRGPDVSPHLRWLPVVTFLQTAFDLPMATTSPHGYGHNFAASSYIDAWIAVTDPPGWNAERTARLKERFPDQPLKGQMP